MSAAGVLRRRSIATRHTAQGASNSRCARNLSATLSTLKPPEISNIRATRPSSDSSIVYPFSSRKRQHDDERESFVPIDERLILRNAPEQRGRLLSQVDIGVLSGMARSRHRRLGIRPSSRNSLVASSMEKPLISAKRARASSQSRYS